MIRKPIQTSSRVILGILGVAILCGCYTWLSHMQHQKNANDRTIPSWSQLGEGWQKAVQLDENGRLNEAGEPIERWLLVDLKATLIRLTAGLGLGVLLAVVLGLAMGCFTPFGVLLLPVVSFLAKIPPTAMMAVFFVIVGINFEMYVAMIAFGVFPSLAQTVYLSVRNDIQEELIQKTYTLGASHQEVIWNVILRQILPKILDAARLQVGPAMVFLIAAEWSVGAEGFGYRIKIQQRLVDMRVVYVYLMVLGVVGFVMDNLLIRLRRRLCPWFAE